MFDLKREQEFNLADYNTTSQLHWWQQAEPIWATATRYKKKAFLKHWSRCDVPFNEVKPAKCTRFVWEHGPQMFRQNLREAANSLKKDYELVMVTTCNFSILFT